MIKVKPTRTILINKVFLKYAELLKDLNQIENEFTKSIYNKYILFEAIREIAYVEEINFDIEFMENNIQYQNTNNLVKDRIDIEVNMDTHKYIFQSLNKQGINTNESIDNLLGESLKISFEKGDKYIIWLCSDQVFQTYLNNYSKEYLFKIDDLTNSHNFEIKTKQLKDCFKISTIMDPISIKENIKLIAFKII
jgi:hypothetical protein